MPTERSMNNIYPRWITGCEAGTFIKYYKDSGHNIFKYSIDESIDDYLCLLPSPGLKCSSMYHSVEDIVIVVKRYKPDIHVECSSDTLFCLLEKLKDVLQD